MVNGVNQIITLLICSVVAFRQLLCPAIVKVLWVREYHVLVSERIPFLLWGGHSTIQFRFVSGRFE